MKPIHLNLAAKPYRDYRPYIAVVVIASLVTALLALNNVDTWLRYQHDTRATRGDTNQLNVRIEREQRRTDDLNKVLRTFDVKTLGAQANYVNARLAERAFSWSELLDRLEHVLPDDARLETVSPSFNKDGMVHVALQCVGKGNDTMVTTLDRLNHDSHFANAFPANEDKTVDGYHFAISADYRPSIARAIE